MREGKKEMKIEEGIRSPRVLIHEQEDYSKVKIELLYINGVVINH